MLIVMNHTLFDRWEWYEDPSEASQGVAGSLGMFDYLVPVGFFLKFPYGAVRSCELRRGRLERGKEKAQANVVSFWCLDFVDLIRWISFECSSVRKGFPMASNASLCSPEEYSPRTAMLDSLGLSYAGVCVRFRAFFLFCCAFFVSWC